MRKTKTKTKTYVLIFYSVRVLNNHRPYARKPCAKPAQPRQCRRNESAGGISGNDVWEGSLLELGASHDAPSLSYGRGRQAGWERSQNERAPRQ